MKPYAVIALACLICLCLSLTAARAGAPYTGPQGFYLVSNNDADPLQYSPTSPAANWEITQSGAAISLPVFTHSGSAWTTQDAQQQVTVSDAASHWTETIAQFGAACAAGEFDSFVQPAAQADTGDEPFLNTVAALNSTGAVTLNTSSANRAAPCATDQASAAYGIVLKDVAVFPNQRLFYSLKLASICLSGCEPPAAGAVWFWNGRDEVTSLGGVTTWNYGVSDSPLSFGLAAVTKIGVKTTYTVNFLPRLKALIASEGNGIDTDIGDWQFAGDTRGDAEWGSVDFSTTWERWKMTY